MIKQTYRWKYSLRTVSCTEFLFCFWLCTIHPCFFCYLGLATYQWSCKKGFTQFLIKVKKRFIFLFMGRLVMINKQFLVLLCNHHWRHQESIYNCRVRFEIVSFVSKSLMWIGYRSEWARHAPKTIHVQNQQKIHYSRIVSKHKRFGII